MLKKGLKRGPSDWVHIAQMFSGLRNTDLIRQMLVETGNDECCDCIV